MRRAFWSGNASELAAVSEETFVGTMTGGAGGVEGPQQFAWLGQLKILKPLARLLPTAEFHFEFQIPRVGKRVDLIIFREGIVYVVEFKVGSGAFASADRNQALDYALDLKNFHEGSHNLFVVPILIATEAPEVDIDLSFYPDRVAKVLCSDGSNLVSIIDLVHSKVRASGIAQEVDASVWLNSRYKPTPTIVEAAQTFYAGQQVEELLNNEAGHRNLTTTAGYISRVVEESRAGKRKSICFVTGVPGSGKTLAGLNIANRKLSDQESENAVFLSGNAPLVEVLQEALVRDEISRAKAQGIRINKKDAERKAGTFIQLIHHFRDDALIDLSAPVNKVVIFDEAQRAWNAKKTSQFMRQKKNRHDFNASEADFLLSVMDRHDDWCTVICLVGTGQEINTGEAGLGEWFQSIKMNRPDWDVHLSDSLVPNDYLLPEDGETLDLSDWQRSTDLHLNVSVRSFRAEQVSDFVASFLDGDFDICRQIAGQFEKHYPMVFTRNLHTAKGWAREKQRGSERIGLLASSNAYRLRADGINVQAKIKAGNWFLDGSDDVRSSYMLEEAATEFDVQGLEIDWAVVCWDANLRFQDEAWRSYLFRGTVWNSMKDRTKKAYLKNAYRVLLTRARQGQIIYVPEGDLDDETRSPSFYDGIAHALKLSGLVQI